MLRLHGGLGELVGVHLPQALVALGLLEAAARALQAAQGGDELLVGVGVDDLLLAPPRAGDLDAVQGRDGGEDPARLDHGAHVAEEEGQQEGADVGAVDVGVGHEDDLAVAGGLQVKGASAAGADHLDDGRALDVAQHVGLGGLLHVEDLAADRQERLELGVAGVLGGPQGGVALDDEQLRGGDVVAAAVGELGRQGGGLQGGLAAGDLLVQARRDAGAHLTDDLLLQGARLGLEVPFGGGQQGGELALDHLGDDLAHGPGTQDLLGLALELGLGDAHGDDGGQARHDVVLLDAAVLGGELQGPGVGLDALAQHLGEGLLESGQVGAAHGGGDDVDEGAFRGVVADPPAQGDVDHAGALDLHGA